MSRPKKVPPVFSLRSVPPRRAARVAIEVLIWALGYARTTGFRALNDDTYRALVSFSDEDLEHAVSVGHGRRFGGGDHENVVGGQTEPDDTAGDARGRVDHDPVGLVLQGGKVPQQAVLLAFGHVGKLVEPGGAADDAEPPGTGLDHFLHRSVPSNDVGDIVSVANAHHEIEIGQGDISVHEKHALAGRGQADGQVRGDVGLSHAAADARRLPERCKSAA